LLLLFNPGGALVELSAAHVVGAIRWAHTSAILLVVVIVVVVVDDGVARVVVTGSCIDGEVGFGGLAWLGVLVEVCNGNAHPSCHFGVMVVLGLGGRFNCECGFTGVGGTLLEETMLIFVFVEHPTIFANVAAGPPQESSQVFVHEDVLLELLDFLQRDYFALPTFAPPCLLPH
jgi:hypothetical protein